MVKGANDHKLKVHLLVWKIATQAFSVVHYCMNFSASSVLSTSLMMASCLYCFTWSPNGYFCHLMSVSFQPFFMYLYFFDCSSDETTMVGNLSHLSCSSSWYSVCCLWAFLGSHLLLRTAKDCSCATCLFLRHSSSWSANQSQSPWKSWSWQLAPEKLQPWACPKMRHQE